MNVMVSIIIPVYNVERYLRRCLDSAANQTLRDIEIICVDDGSTDSSGVICDEYAARDERFIVIHQKNARQAAARNRALEIARGKYISFLDGDDLFEPDMAEHALKKALETDADVVRFYFRYIGRYNGKPDKRLWFEGEINGSLSTLRVFFLPGSDVWARLWKREFLQKNNIKFQEDLPPWEDILFNAQAAAAQPKTFALPEALHKYRIWSNSSMRNHGKSIDGMKHLLNAMNESIRIFESNDERESAEFLYGVKFKYIYCSYNNNYCGTERENEIFDLLRAELDEANRRMLRKVKKTIPRDARIFYLFLPSLLGPPSFKRWVCNKMMSLCVKILFPFYTRLYYLFHC